MTTMIDDDDIPPAPVPQDWYERLEEQITLEHQGVKTECDALFRQGELLIEFRPTAEQYANLAQHFGISVSTFRERREVSETWPIQRRRDGLPWTIYKLLLRVDNPDEQDRLLDEQQNWTTDKMRRRLRRWVEQNNGGSRFARPPTRGGFNLDGIKVNGELKDNNIVISVDRPPGEEPSVTVTPTSFIIIATLGKKRKKGKAA